MPNRDDIIELARSYLGVRWLHQGRGRNGIDCAGLVIVVGNELKLIDYDTADYQRRTSGHAFLHHFQMNMKRIPLPEARPGDVMLFRDAQFPCHSVILGWKDQEMTMIHAHAPHRKVVEEALADGDWIARRVAAFKFEGLDDG